MKINQNSTLNLPTISYHNSDTQKLQILKDNVKKTGVYRWTNLLSNKSYIGSSIDLSTRLKNYYNTSYLEKEIKKNNSMIYRSLLKNGYSNFKLDILEYCDTTTITQKEQYYIDLLLPEYNILKTAKSLKGFRHCRNSIELIRASKLGRKRTEIAKLKIATGSKKAYSVVVINNNTREKSYFLSIRKAAEYIKVHHSYIAKCIKNNQIYNSKLYTVVKAL